MPSCVSSPHAHFPLDHVPPPGGGHDARRCCVAPIRGGRYRRIVVSSFPRLGARESGRSMGHEYCPHHGAGMEKADRTKPPSHTACHSGSNFAPGDQREARRAFRPVRLDRREHPSPFMMGTGDKREELGPATRGSERRRAKMLMLLSSPSEHLPRAFAPPPSGRHDARR